MPMLNLIRYRDGVKQNLAMTTGGTECMTDWLGWDVRHGMEDISKGRHQDGKEREDEIRYYYRSPRLAIYTVQGDNHKHENDGIHNRWHNHHNQDCNRTMSLSKHKRGHVEVGHCHVGMYKCSISHYDDAVIPTSGPNGPYFGSLGNWPYNKVQHVRWKEVKIHPNNRGNTWMKLALIRNHRTSVDIWRLWCLHSSVWLSDPLVTFSWPYSISFRFIVLSVVACVFSTMWWGFLVI